MNVTIHTSVTTGSVTATKVKYLQVINQHASAAGTVNGASLAAGQTLTLPLLEGAKTYPDIVIDGTSSSLLINAVMEDAGAAVS